MKNFSNGIIIVIILIAVVWIGSLYGDIKQLDNNIRELERKNAYLVDSLSTLEYSLSDYQDALEEANNNIEEANSTIEDAQGVAWSTYEEMGDALDNLTTVDTVSEP